MSEPPFVDEHAIAVAAPPDAVWAALVHRLGRDMGGAEPFALLLGCEPARGTPDFSGGEGETLPGFRVLASEPGERLALGGRHRFSDYRLTFVLEEGRLAARTHAAFPGLKGRAYRAAVIGSGAHRVITRRILSGVRRRAERPGS